jgi:hypothetical protein
MDSRNTYRHKAFTRDGDFDVTPWMADNAQLLEDIGCVGVSYCSVADDYLLPHEEE